uniref:Uncharacterized protein n=1 Tax=Ananas comosus var. bracteatus TaxID=296719 RepID=A0A6V7NFN4_ANACO|nr:unnamed protein product [Ananas comosus var. bracteatus]
MDAHNVPNSSSAASCYERKRTRGKTIGLKWAKKRKEEKAKPAIEIPEDLRRVKYKTDEQRRAHCPADIDPDHWNWLIDYWSNPKFKRISEANKANRSKQTMVARVGTKSIARNLIEMRKEVEKNMEENNEAPEEPEYVRLWGKLIYAVFICDSMRVV